MEWATKTTIPLVQSVRMTIEANRGRLCHLLTASPETIHKKLDPYTYETEKVRIKRKKILSKYNPRTQLGLLRVLYPSDHSLFMNHTRKGNTHSALFKQYSKVDLNTIEPEHLNEFIRIFLNNDRFKRPARILNFDVGADDRLNPGAIAHGYLKSVNYRTNYLNQLNMIFNDLRQQNLPTSKEEQNKLMYYMFFKDKKSVLARVQNAFMILEKDIHPQPQFTFEFYNSLNVTDTTSLNNILNISVMQNNLQVFQHVSERIEPDRQTFIIWLKAYSNEFKDLQKFNEIISRINVNMDITLLNEVMKGLIQLQQYDRAEEIVDSLELSHINDDIYTHLSPQSVSEYNRQLVYYDCLSKHFDMPPITLIPNIATFTPFLRHYIETNQFSKALQMIHKIKHFNLPLTTKTFTILFSQSLPPPIAETFLKLFLQEFQGLYTFDNDVSTDKPHNNHGQLLKITDHLLARITKCLSHIQDVDQLYLDLGKQLRVIRKQSSSKDLFIKNEITYLKMSYLQHIHTISSLNGLSEDTEGTKA